MQARVQAKRFNYRRRISADGLIHINSGSTASALHSYIAVRSAVQNGQRSHILQ
jgi:hypothetical protein